LLLFLPLLAWADTPAVPAQEPVELSVGDTKLLFPIEPGYVRVSAMAPHTFEVSAAAMPTTNRLVEAFYLESDLKKVLLGGAVEGTYFQVQAFRDVEKLDLNQADWISARASITAGMGKIDMAKYMADERKAMNARISATSSGAAPIDMMVTSNPQIYVTDDNSARFTMVISVKTGGSETPTKVALAGAIVHARNKVLMICAGQLFESIASVAAVTKRLDAATEAFLALNATHAQEPDAKPAAAAAGK
jgi:hypothetical protein